MSKKYLSFAVVASALILAGAGCSSSSSVSTNAPTDNTAAPAASTGDQADASTDQTATPPAADQTATPPAADNAANGPMITIGDTGPAPVTLTASPLNRTKIPFKLKINSDKTIEQVDVEAYCVDANGQTQDDGTYAWENIVPGSKKEPIVKGKTYSDEYDGAKGYTSCKLALKTVHYTDGTSWTGSN